MNDPVNHPTHYTSGSKEFLDIAKDLFMRDKGVDLSVLDDIGMQEYTEDYKI